LYISDSSPNSYDGWLTTQEAASYLKVRARTLLMWVRRGQIHGYQLSGTKRHVWRFRREDLDAALGLSSSAAGAVLQSGSSSVARVQ
jgi:excisionase family DNA binding protein